MLLLTVLEKMEITWRVVVAYCNVSAPNKRTITPKMISTASFRAPCVLLSSKGASGVPGVHGLQRRGHAIMTSSDMGTTAYCGQWSALGQKLLQVAISKWRRVSPISEWLGQHNIKSVTDCVHTPGPKDLKSNRGESLTSSRIQARNAKAALQRQ